ncbi:MAG: glycosyltransferase, partial [Planctomycetota bacterium]
MANPTAPATNAALAYLVPEFPSQTHAFFWRELQAIEQAGVRVQLFSTRRPPADACQHAFAGEATARTTYVYPPSLADAGWLLTRITRWPACLGYLNSLTGSGPKNRIKFWLKRLGLLACAAGLARRCKRDQLQHLHAHSCADAAHLAALAHHLIGLPFSTTLHGDLPVYGTDHPQKAKPAAFVAAVTKPLQQQLINDAGLTPDRAPVVWMGVDTDRFGGGGGGG